jgi:hypothetical protein
MIACDQMKKALLIIISSIIINSTLFSQESLTRNIPPDKVATKYYSTLSGTDTTADKQLRYLTDYLRSNQPPPPEKIYVHTDRTTYMVQDTIWFKAYSWCGYEQVADTLSKVLYAELVNERGRKLISKKLLIENGISIGEFIIDTTIVPGKYFIRAYTQWMKNHAAGEPFISTVRISSFKQNFHIECNPAILRRNDRDSLLLKFGFFELDLNGNLKSSIKHDINFVLKSGEQVLDSGKITSANTIYQIIRTDLSRLDKKQIITKLDVSVNDGGVSYSRTFEIPVSEGLDMQFFPEGGTFVAGLQNRIAFKITGSDGLSRNIDGVIETKMGDTVTTFHSYNKGMGSFLLNPAPGKQYFGHFIYKERNYLVPLPAASENGCIMTIRNNPGGNPVLILRYSPSEKNSFRYITGSTHGNVWFSAFLKLTGDSCRFSIPMNFLPEGICRITLLTSDFKPLIERLLYVNKDNRFRVDIRSDSISYMKRSKVSISVSASGTDGTPVEASLSVAVVDKELTKGNKTDNGIVSYQLLESELKGNIEDPGYYFEKGNYTDPDALDLLMLTQGYRTFIKDNDSSIIKEYPPETNFHISGRLLSDKVLIRSKKDTYSNISLILMCFADTPYLSLSHPDSLGRFSLDIPLLYGQPRSLLQANNYRGKKFNGEIQIDEPTEQHEFPLPGMTLAERTEPVFENVAQLQTAIKTTLYKDPAYGYMSRDLPEVVVKAKAKNWYLDYKKDAVKIADLDSLDPTGNKYESLTDLLVREFGGILRLIPHTGMKTALLPCLSVMGPNEWFPVYVVNDFTWFDGHAGSNEEFLSKLSWVSNIPVNEIKKLSVLKPGDIASHYADPGISMDIRQSCVIIETYKKGFRGDPPGIKSLILEGLDAPREFYSPRYDNPAQNNYRYDGRTTLFWEPDLKTDSTGKARIEFYTSDRNSDFEVIVNGILQSSGSPGHGRKVISYGR